MKRIIISGITLLAIALGAIAHAQTFTPGNLVIYRLGGDANGNSSGALTNSGTRVWLDEYTTSGTFVQSHPMPTNYFGANSPLIGAGTTFGSGLINRSADGRFIYVCGYGETIGQLTNFTLESETGTQVPRVVGSVDGNGNIDTTTTLTNFYVSTYEVRSATSPDGTNFWFGTDGGGISYTVHGSNDATHLSTTDQNLRQITVVSNTLYFCSATIFMGTEGTQPPPMTNGSSEATLPGISAANISPFCFSFQTLNGGTGPDTLYIADSTSNNVIKYSLTPASTNWINNGSIGFGNVLGLTTQIRVVGTTTNVDLFVTGGGSTLTGGDNLWATTDSGGYNAAPIQTGNSPFVPLATASSSVSFRGIAFAPVGGQTFPSGPGQISVGPILGIDVTGSTGCSTAATQTYSVANFGTNGINWTASADQTWVTLSSTSGSLASSNSVTITATLNGGVTSLSTGTNTSTITFSDSTNTTTRAVRLVLHAQDVSPSSSASGSSFNSSGAVGGPFTPSNKVYTVYNGSGPITLVISNSAATWLSISPTTVALAGCTSTNITVSINQANADLLTLSNYNSTIIFSNATAGTAIDSNVVQLVVGNAFFCTDFSTYIQNANLVPQQGWVADGTGLEPIVSNNAVYVKAASAAAADEPYRTIPQLSNGTVFAGMVMTITSAPPVSVASPSRMVCFFGGQQNESGFANCELSVRDTGTGTFVFCVRPSSFQPWVIGTNALNYNTSYRVILQGDVAESNEFVYVNPSSALLNTSTANVFTNGVTDPGGTLCGSFSIQNTFTSATTIQPGVAFNKICISTNYADVYNDITPVVPPSDPFTTWENMYFNPTQLGNPSISGPGADPFGKGMSNTNQFLAGFDPTNTSAYVHITHVATTNSTDIRVDYLGAAGSAIPAETFRTNVLEFTAGSGGNYNSNSFASTGVTNVLSGGTGQGALTNMVDPGGATHTPSRYYRVRVVVP
jgi:hypothetical protein